MMTGPDHLSAMATLTANVGNANCVAFWLGIRWGIGHSTGLLIVGTVFIILSLSSEEDNVEIPESVQHIFEYSVGVFMLLLGFYGCRRAWYKRPKTQAQPDGPLSAVVCGSDEEAGNSREQQEVEMEKIAGSKEGDADEGGSSSLQAKSSDQDEQQPKSDEPESPVSCDSDKEESKNSLQQESETEKAAGSMERGLDQGDVSESSQGKSSIEVKYHPKPAEHDISQDRLSPELCGADEEVSKNSELKGVEMEKIHGSKEGGSRQGDVSESIEGESSTKDEHSSHGNGCVRTLKSWASNLSIRTMALGAGIIHGLAGPGGVLGIIPAVQLHSASLATLYLATFCISSTITMGIFATLYGTCTRKLAESHPSSGSVTAAASADHVASHTASLQKRNRLEFWIESFSACLSIIVGIIWLTLLSLGKLEILDV